jgi:hypothetical protein
MLTAYWLELAKMSFNSIKGKILVAVSIAILVLVVASSLRPREKHPKDQGLTISFSEVDLVKLGDALESLEFEDLGGFLEENSSVLGFTEEDLNSLANALNELEFEDLGGLQDR